MLSITNVIMDELLGDERTPRAFRAKFPEEVLQESLAGQLWFGAECLAAGSFIMNREWESGTMRPLARAVTKSLDIVRNLLREQCLRIKTPNSLRLNLDTNDASTETLCESLKIFDRLFAEFELLYVSAMVQVKTKQEHETQELICVLFSETLQRALRIGHLSQEQVDYFDPALMFSIPRLAIVAGLVVFSSGPLNLSNADQLSEMFRPFRTLLIKIRDLLETLTPAELLQLELLLCTNEEVAAAGTSTNMLPGNGAVYTATNCDASSAGKEAGNDANVINGESPSVMSNNRLSSTREAPYQRSPNEMDGFEVNLNHSVELDGWDEHKSSNDSHAGNGSDGLEEFLDAVGRIEFGDNKSMADSMDSSNELPSGFLISNTNLGNLLQPIDAPLTDRFIVSEDEMVNSNDAERSHQLLHGVADSGHCTGENTSQDQTPDTEERREVVPETHLSSSRRESVHWEHQASSVQGNDNPSTSHNSQASPQQHRGIRFGRRSRSSTDQNHNSNTSSSSRKSNSPSSSSTTSASSTSSSESAGSTAQRTLSTHTTHSRKKVHRASKRVSTAVLHETTTSGEDSSSSSASISSGDDELRKLANQTVSRMQIK